MSEQETREFFEKIRKGIREAQRTMFERKMKLGEEVVIADENGMPLVISAEEALRRFDAREPEQQ